MKTILISLKRLSPILLLLVLIACATNKNTPTPTIVPLDRSATVQNQSQPDDASPTVTPILLPSATPTFFPTPVNLPTITPTSPTSNVRPQVEVLVAWLNVRQGPGVDYPIINVAQAGDVFEVIGVNPKSDWLQVIIEDGGSGWISGQMPYTRLLGAGLDSATVISPPPVPSLSTPVSVGDNGGLRGKLIFMTGSGGELYRINVDGSDQRLLTNGVIDPVVSPDGQEVAFTRWDGAEFGTLYTIKVDGTGERAILGDIRQPKSPTWSPDGQKIVISFQHGGLRDPSERCRNFKPGQEINIPKINITVTSLHVGRNGEVDICYLPFEDLQWRLRLIDVATGEFEDLPSDAYSYNPAWDLRNPWRVVYDGDKGLMQLDVTNGRQWPITRDLRDTGPVFSPDGQTMALTYKQHDHWEVYTLELETGERKRLTKPPILADPQYNSTSPAWSPDGSQMAFVTDRTGWWEIWVMNADGSNPRPLFPPEIQAQFRLEYHGVNERMLNWIE